MCKHGIPLTSETGDTHEVDCALCERPTSRDERALAGLMEFRRAERRARSHKMVLEQLRLIEEQEKRNRTKKEHEKALRQFAERQERGD